MIVSKTPLRISFFGGGTDFPDFYEKYGGEVISTTIDKYVYCLVKDRLDQHFYIKYAKNETAKSIYEVKNELVRACLMESHKDIASSALATQEHQHEHINFLPRGKEIVLMSDLPQGTGLGSSSAFAVGLLKSLYLSVQGIRLASPSLASQACKIELDIMGKPIGKQDQYACAFGGFNHIKFEGDGKVNVVQLKPDANTMTELKDNMMLFYTGIQRDASQILSKQKRDIGKNGHILINFKKYVDRFREILLHKPEDLDYVGHMLDECWQLKQQLASGISPGWADKIYNRAIHAGALGGKLCGAGGGGFFLFYVPQTRQRAVKEQLSDLEHVKFWFEGDGPQVQEVFSQDTALGTLPTITV